MLTKSLSCKPSSVERFGTTSCIRIIKADTSYSRLVKSLIVNGKACNTSCYIAGHISILLAAEAWRYGWLLFIPVGCGSTNCWAGAAEYGLVILSILKESWLVDDGYGEPKLPGN